MRKPQFLPVPKLLKWSRKLDQHYSIPQAILVTSGCSFTSSTLQLEGPASWPGFVMDRCGMDHCMDYSFPGAGNEYIGDSILHHFKDIDDVSDYFVAVMWSGLDRQSIKTTVDQQPKLGDVSYTTKQGQDCAQQSADKIIEVYNYLTNRSIPFVFTFYANVLFPPYFPKRDTTPNFEGTVDKTTLSAIQALAWVPTVSEQFLFEYALISGDLDLGDHFHPTREGNLAWTDNVLLKALCSRGQILEFSNRPTNRFNV